MDRLNLQQHISQQYNVELETLRESVLAMGGMVEQQLASALRVLATRDAAGLHQVVADEQRVDEFELEIDELCSRILVRRQPAATDLRLVLATIKIIADLERIGDEAAGIARQAEKLIGTDLEDALRVGFAQMGAQVRGMLRVVLDALARLDVAAATAAIGLDREVDERYRTLIAGVGDSMQADAARVPAAIELLFALRSLERIGDHCRNVAEHVAYLVQGRDVRHSGYGRDDEP